MRSRQGVAAWRNGQIAVHSGLGAMNLLAALAARHLTNPGQQLHAVGINQVNGGFGAGQLCCRQAHQCAECGGWV